jgi:hypothetical protein
MSELHAPRHDAPPLHQVVPHSEAGSVPLAAALHVPSAPATLHASHVPLHALLQQYPSAQLPERHCAPEVQALPVANSPSHEPALQLLPGLQSSAAFTQGEMQAPAPSHQALPQSPERSSPRGTGEQVPTRPVTLQALQAPPHALSQHTPSTHWPEAHSFPAAHAVPFPFFAAQLPPAQ